MNKLVFILFNVLILILGIIILFGGLKILNIL
jgi:hypothetical protein